MASDITNGSGHRHNRDPANTIRATSSGTFEAGLPIKDSRVGASRMKRALAHPEAKTVIASAWRIGGKHGTPVTIATAVTAITIMPATLKLPRHSGRMPIDPDVARNAFIPATMPVIVMALIIGSERSVNRRAGILEVRMRILIASWRCPMHPRAGGAEYLTVRIAAGLVRRGHQVTWFASRGAGLPGEAIIDGIRIIRRTRQATVHAYFGIWLKLLDLQRHRFDVIVDQINTIPFFAHWYTSVPTVAFVHQLAREVWFYETGRLTAHVGYFMEPRYLSPYRQVPLVTDSMSSLKSLREIGLLGSASVIPMGCDPPGVPSEEVGFIPLTLRLVVTCRLVHSKRVDHALRTVALLHWRGMPVSIDIIGTGSTGPVIHLRNLVSILGIAHIVFFHGRLTDTERDRIVASSFAMVGTSAREGWGLSITEGNALGVPGAVYPVPGLCDSTIHDRTGVISREATPPSLADAIERLWRNRDLYLACRAGAREHANGLSWDRTVEAFEQALLKVIH